MYRDWWDFLKSCHGSNMVGIEAYALLLVLFSTCWMLVLFFEKTKSKDLKSRLVFPSKLWHLVASRVNQIQKKYASILYFCDFCHKMEYFDIIYYVKYLEKYPNLHHVWMYVVFYLYKYHKFAIIVYRSIFPNKTHILPIICKHSNFLKCIC